MIGVIVCGWLLRGLVWVFGVDSFAIAFACNIAQPTLNRLEEFLQEVPL